MSGGVAAQLHKLRETKPQLFDYYQSPDPHYAEVRKEIMDWIEKADKVLAVLANFPDKLEKELRRMWSESDTQMIMAVVDEVLAGGVEAPQFAHPRFASEETMKKLKEGKTVCLSCEYELQEDDELYEGYGCPKCQSPLVVKVERVEAT